MRIELEADIDDAVQRNAVPCQAVVAGDARSDAPAARAQAAEAVMAPPINAASVNPNATKADCR